MKRYLSIDLGATNGKSILVSFDGKRITLEEIFRFANVPVKLNGFLYWNVLNLHNNILNSIEISLAKHKELTSVGIDTWGVDFGLLDSKGFLLGNPFHYRNAYRSSAMKEALEMVGKEWIFHRCPTQFQPFNTLYQLINLEEINFQALKIAETLLGMPALLTYFLTGEKFIEFTYATTTQIYNPYIKDWDKEIIERFNLPDIFPKIVQPSTKIGELKVNEKTKKVSVIAVASHDTASAFASTMVDDEETLIISSGTWFLEGIITSTAYKKDDVLKYNFANEGCIDGKYRLLANVTGMWIIEQLMKKWKKHLSSLSYADITAMAKNSEAFNGFIDVDSKELQKVTDMETEVVKECHSFSGKELKSKGEIVRVVLESLALKTRWVKEKLEGITAKKIKTIRMVGGVTRNDFACQLISNATHLPLIAGPIEGTAVGNAISQIIADENVKRGELKKIVENSFDFEYYLPQDNEKWDEVYDKYKMLLKERGENHE